MDPCTPPLSFQVGGATANLMFGTSQASTTIQLSGTAGTGLSQVTPTSPPFPLYTGTGTAQLYIAVASSANVSFAQTPAINYQFGTTPTYAGCGLYVYASSGSNVYSWNLVAPATGSTPVSGSSVNIPATTLTNGTVNLTTTPTYVTIVCQ